MPLEGDQKPIIMVSSAVYGWEDLLEQIFSYLETFGYEVYMSHMGTVPLGPRENQFDACIRAVETCDIFLSILLPRYGSGKESPDEPSITHRELMRAVELEKPRYSLVHHHIPIARKVLTDYGYGTAERRKTLTLTRPDRTPLLDDLRLIDMYDLAAALRDADDVKIPAQQRVDGWVQEFRTDREAIRFVTTQLANVDKIRTFLIEEKLRKEAEAAKAAEAIQTVEIEADGPNKAVKDD